MEAKAKANFPSYNALVCGNNIKIYISTISPAAAANILHTRNSKNRKINANHVNALKKNIENGSWKFNGDTICFDTNGVLIDGQHRLSAIAYSGVNIPCIIVEGLSPDAIKTKDMEVKPRNLSDLLRMDGVKYNKNIAATIVRYFGLANGRSILTSKSSGGTGVDKELKMFFTIEDKYNFYYQNKVVIDALAPYSESLYKKVKLLSQSEIGSIFLYLFLDKHHSEDEIKGFFDGLFFTSTLNVIVSLRNKLITDMSDIKKMSGSYKQSLIAKVWNYYIKGKDVKVLSYSPSLEGKIDFI